MSCYAYSEVGRVSRKVDALDRRQREGFNELARALQRIEKALDERLDTIEQAVVDPQGEAAQKLRAKHGMGKPSNPIALKSMSKGK